MNIKKMNIRIEMDLHALIWFLFQVGGTNEFGTLEGQESECKQYIFNELNNFVILTSIYK